jgi:membrane protein implicated in regulation of membrane protease activity
MLKLRRSLKHVLTVLIQRMGDPSQPLVSEAGSVDNYRDDSREAIVTQSIRPGRTGQVKFKGSWWNARCSWDVNLLEGQIVYVIDRRDNTLYVEPGFKPIQKLTEFSPGFCS